MAYCVVELTIGAGERFSVRQLFWVNAGEADLGDIGVAVKRARSASSFFVLQAWETAPSPMPELPVGAFAVLSGVTAEQLNAGDFASAELKEAPTSLGPQFKVA
jgi:hypothetical protein